MPSIKSTIGRSSISDCPNEMASRHGRKLFARAKGLPFQAALGALEGMIDVVIGGVAGAGVGLGQSELIVEVRMLVANAPATGGARAARFLFAKPTQHK